MKHICLDLFYAYCTKNKVFIKDFFHFLCNGTYIGLYNCITLLGNNVRVIFIILELLAKIANGF